MLNLFLFVAGNALSEFEDPEKAFEVINQIETSLKRIQSLTEPLLSEILANPNRTCEGGALKYAKPKILMCPRI